MSEITLDIYRHHSHQRVDTCSDPEVVYSACHDAVESDACNTGATKDVLQYHRDPGGECDHEFGIRRLGMFFDIDIPAGSTISSATLKLEMRKYSNPFGDEDWDWTLSIRHNSTLSDPGEAGGCPTGDFPKCLGGTQIASKYVDDLETYAADYEFNLSTAHIVPQAYLKLSLVSSRDLASTAPDSEVSHIYEAVNITSTPQLVLVYTPPATEVTTNPATLVTGVSATLNGTLTDGGGEACDCSFQWGLTDAYGETTAPVSKETDDTFDAGISELTPGTTYHFRAKAVNSFSTFYGADLTFTCPGYFAWII